MKLIHFVLVWLIPCAFVEAAPVAKKGIGLASPAGTRQSVEEKVSSLRVGWTYNWTGEQKGRSIEGVTFVPMVWGNKNWSLKALESLEVDESERTLNPLLGFNEPDGKKQANMSVDEAIELWPSLEETNRRLGSPATVHADNQWMRAFMKEAEKRNYRVDFICVHWYGGNNPDGFIRHLQRIHDLYDKPIWITEFAVADWSASSLKKNKHSPKDVLSFMKEVLPELDKLDFVERYAWFTSSPDHAKLGPSALFRKDGSLTELGKFYSTHPD